MLEIFTRRFDPTGFPRRWDCGDWSNELGWLHILSDLGVWSAYVAITCVLGDFAIRTRDVPFRPLFRFFGAFILAYGSTHLMEGVIFWWPAYRLAGALKLFTAMVSWGTVMALVSVTPRALAMRTPEELGRRVAERAAELARAYESLRAEVLGRRRAERVLQESEEQFRTLADSIPQLAWMAGPDGSITWYNRRWYQFTGTTPKRRPRRHPGVHGPALEARRGSRGERSGGESEHRPATTRRERRESRRFGFLSSSKVPWEGEPPCEPASKTGSAATWRPGPARPGRSLALPRSAPDFRGVMLRG